MPATPQPPVAAARATRKLTEAIAAAIDAVEAEYGFLDVHSRRRRTARAILAAIREPTAAQLIGARNWSAAKDGKPLGNEDATGCWRAMIDAELSEDDSGRKALAESGAT